MTNKSLLLALILGTQVSVYQPIQCDAHDSIATAGAALVLAGGTYLAGRSSASVLSWCAKRRFAQPLALINSAESLNSQIKDQLKQIILDNHEEWYNQGPCRNYPLVACKNDLDWYIAGLWWLRAFYAGSSSWYPAQELLEDLRTIRALIITDYTFIQERRDFEKQQAKRVALR